MKLLPIILCFLITFNYEIVDGQKLVQGFLGRLHDGREKVRTDLHKFTEKTKSDIHNLLQPFTGRKNDDSLNAVDKVKSKSDASTTSSTTTSAPRVEGSIVFPTEEPIVIPTQKFIPYPTGEAAVIPAQKPLVSPKEDAAAVPTQKPLVSPKEDAAAVPTQKPLVSPKEEASAVPTQMPIIVFPTEEPVVTTPKAGNETESKGKENFSGGCLTGFMRTSDGRCMPTY